jgi:DNA invertase Pin-like site-specific DNA recombinase
MYNTIVKRHKADRIAAIYARSSAAGDLQRGVALATQEELLTHYCHLRGLDPAFVLRETGSESGGPLAGRPLGARLLQLIADRLVSDIVVLKVEYLWNNTVDSLGIIREWQRAGVALHIADLGGQAIDTSAALGWLVYVQGLGLTDFERRRAGERLSAARARRQREGRRHHSRPVYGFDLRDGRLRPNPAEQLVITRMRWMRRLGLSFGKIAHKLNEDQTPTKRGGRAWYASTVRQVLKNELHAAG